MNNNLERVLEKFAASNKPFFLIVDGRFACIGKNTKYTDIQEATDRLKQFLEELDTESKSSYKIYCYEKLPAGKLTGEVKKIINLGDHDGLISYTAWQPKEKEFNQDQADQRAQWKFERLQKEQELQNQLAEIKTLLTARQIEESEETEEDVISGMQPAGIVGTLFNSPEIQQVLAAGIAGLVAKFLVPAGAPQAVAGIPESKQSEATEDNNEMERMAAALEVLREKDKDLCEHLEKLAEMAKNETAKFTFLLTML